MVKYCLIIDNEDQSSNIETIERLARTKNMTIECSQFNVGSTEHEEFLTDNRIDVDKVETEFKKKFKGQTFDLIAFDWDLNDENINGVELIRQFVARKIRKNTPKFLYSGELKEEINGVLDKYKNEKIKFTNAWNQIKTLIEIDIVDFKDRDDYEKAIVNILEKRSPNLETMFLKELRSNTEIIFDGNYPAFEGKSFGEIADIIENDIPRGNKFLISLIEEAMAYMAVLPNVHEEGQDE